MDWRNEIISLVEAYCAATGLSESRVATLAANGGMFFTRIREGGGCNIDNLLKVKGWFVDNWPEGHLWPEGILRSTAIGGSQSRADQITAEDFFPSTSEEVAG